MWGLVLAGISSYMDAENAEDEVKTKGKYDIKTMRARGDEDRRTSFYQAVLDDWRERKAKSDKVKGYGRWTNYAKANQGQFNLGNRPALSNMLAQNTAPVYTDPGAMPTPEALNGDKPNYGALSNFRTRTPPRG